MTALVRVVAGGIAAIHPIVVGVILMGFLLFAEQPPAAAPPSAPMAPRCCSGPAG